MDSTSAIIGIALIAISILPFIILSKNRKKRSKETIEKLNTFASKEGATIHHYDICKNLIIGMDNQKNILFFIKKTDKEAVNKSIPLNDYKSFHLIKETRKVGEKNNSYVLIERLALSFIPIIGNNSPQELEFYNSVKTIQLSTELQTIQKWSEIVAKHFEK